MELFKSSHAARHAAPVFPTPPSWSSTGAPQFLDPPDTTASLPPGSNICYADSRLGAVCYVINVPHKDQKQPVQVFVPGNQLNFAIEGLKRAYAATYEIETKSGLGSGVAVRSIPQADGTFLNLILTNRHVATDEATGKPEDGYIVTSLWTGQKYKGVFLNVLPEGQPDMALVAIKTPTPMATIALADSTRVAFGQQVYAIGNPLGLMGSVTAGIISNPNRPDLMGQNVGGRIIQFDAPISPGNSGGPLITTDGQLIGLNTFTIPGDANNPAQNINFAFPADVGLQMLTQGLPVASASVEALRRAA